MHSWTGRSLIAFAAALLLAGCSQPPATPPSTAPSFRCTPEAGGAEFDCTQQQYDEMLAKDKLYAEAEAVYRRFLAEEIRILRAGGTDSPTAVIEETTSGSFFDEVMADFVQAKRQSISVDQGDREVVSVERMTGVAKGGSAVALAICVDSRSVHFLRNGESEGVGGVTRDELYFGNFDGRLKVIGADGKGVDEC